jgi:hypothetical protein
VTGRFVVRHARMRGCHAQLFGWAWRVQPKKVGTAIRENDWPHALFDSRLVNEPPANGLSSVLRV